MLRVCFAARAEARSQCAGNLPSSRAEGRPEKSEQDIRHCIWHAIGSDLGMCVCFEARYPF